LWYRAVQYEGVKQIDVIHHEEARAARIETRRTNWFHSRASEIDDAAAETALQPIVLVGIKKNSEKNEQRRNQKEMQAAQDPEKRAAYGKQSALHI
jgi:hypothetical protein